jgi:hypothetical protein
MQNFDTHIDEDTLYSLIANDVSHVVIAEL